MDLPGLIAVAPGAQDSATRAWASAGLRVAQADGVATLTLDRPAVRNAISTQLCVAITEAVTAAGRDDTVRALVLTGAGPTFCAGGDLNTLGKAESLELRARINRGVRPAIHALMTIGKPVIAALNGAVAGAGIGLALACDHVIAVENARLVIAFGKLGLIPDAAVLYQLAHNVGLLRAKELVLDAEPISARRALELGLYNQVVPSDDFADVVRAKAARYASGPTLAMGMAKGMLRDALRLPYDAFMDLEANNQGLLVSSEDFTEGVAAVTGKREARFQGR